MSSIVTDQGIVHYETFGRGKPVILLHCWLGSWSYWFSTMEFLGKRYKTYALDFWGFGESAKQGSFTIPEYVNMVEQFMDRMGLQRAPIMGHSMGGSVSLSLALTYPQRVSKVAVVGSPTVGSGLSFLLKLAGNQHIAQLLYTLPQAFAFFVKLLSRFYAKDWETWYEMFETDLSRTTMESFSASIRDLRFTDLRPDMHKLRIPAMGIFGRKDNIVSPKQAEVLRNSAADATIHYFENSGHFPMLDETERFHKVVEEFLERE
ncbi:MAG: alpha/beta hydrolase [Anaerolineae bacterium]|nr:alpha/beta hydrolase [Anaerolineae bacterium]